MKKQQMLTQRILAVPLMILFILCVYVLNIPNPMIILIILVLYFTYSDGYISGILSGVAAIAYAIYFFLIKTGDPAGHYKVITIVLSIATIIVLVGKLQAREGEKIIKLKRREEDLVQMATTDKLTGALNRHFLRWGMPFTKNVFNLVSQSPCSLSTSITLSLPTISMGMNLVTRL